MGKEWYWAGRSSKRGSSSSSDAETPSGGCMCAVFQFFDFHPFHFPTTINQQQQNPLKSATCISQDHTTIPKGVEAPRNSLESEEGTTTVSSFSKEDNFKILKNIQIKTSRSSGGNLNEFSSELSSSSSPGIKTPTLVARLMGLDLLPSAADSPSFSSCLSTPNTQGNNNLRTRQQHILQTKHRNSIDSSDIAARFSARRSSDVDYHHRFSLQINKEMMSLGDDELEMLPTRLSFSKRKCDENNNSPKSHHYARQIVKQVKESVSRKVGQDITNTLKSKDQQARDQESLGQFKVKKSQSPKMTSLKSLDESSPGKHSNPSSCSPRLRFIDTKNKPSTTTTLKDQNTHPNVVKTQPQVLRVLTKTKVYELPEQKKKLVPNCKKVTNEKFSSRLKRPPQTSDIIRNNKQEETIIIGPTSSPNRVNGDIKISKSKKAQPLSTNLLNNNNNNVPNLLLVKTDPSPPVTKIPQKQVSDTQGSKHCSQLSSCSRQRYYNKQEGTTTTLATQQTITNTDQDNLNGVACASTTTTTGASQHHTPEFQYITEILNRTNTTWFSSTHPLDPSIFNHLEHHPNDKDPKFTIKNQLGHRWNRRLLFDLVDEVLKEILRPKVSEKRLCFLNGFCYNWNIGELSERVWKRVVEFPCAKCEVLDDIDNLIEAEDMEKVKVEESEEERERLVAEIEGELLDTLVHETVKVIIMDC